MRHVVVLQLFRVWMISRLMKSSMVCRTMKIVSNAFLFPFKLAIKLSDLTSRARQLQRDKTIAGHLLCVGEVIIATSVRLKLSRNAPCEVL